MIFSSKLKGNPSVHVVKYDVKIEDTLYEKKHAKCFKFILNVNKYSSNTAVRGESGRFPVSIKVLALRIKYWHYIPTNNAPNQV